MDCAASSSAATVAASAAPAAATTHPEKDEEEGSGRRIVDARATPKDLPHTMPSRPNHCLELHTQPKAIPPKPNTVVW